MHIYKYNDRVSIHAPTRGATQCRLQHQRIWLVSIHAPTRGATSSALRNISVSAFQSTHPHGVRLTKTEVLRQYRTFQSTHPHGVRRIVADLLSCLLSFNPRTHTGCDLPRPYNTAVRQVSIHAPTRGATNERGYTVRRLAVSIHAPTRGATLNAKSIGIAKLVSIHAPTRGATHRIIQNLHARKCFNPRTHTGCDTW